MRTSAQRVRACEREGERKRRERGGVERCRGRDEERRARREGAREGTSRKRGAVADTRRVKDTHGHGACIAQLCCIQKPTVASKSIVYLPLIGLNVEITPCLPLCCAALARPAVLRHNQNMLHTSA